MAKKLEFPVTLRHPKLKGTTRAATPAKLRHYEARGWKVDIKTSTPATPTGTTPDTSSSPSS